MTRSASNFIFDVWLDANQVKTTETLIVEWPGDFSEAFYKGFNPSCTLNRWIDNWSNLDPTSYVDNCSFVIDRKV